MNKIGLLEQLADSTHHNVDANRIIKQQLSEILSAYLSNDNAQIREYLGESEIVANPSDVVLV